MKRRLSLLIAGASAAGLLSAGLVAAQTAPSPAPPAAQTPSPAAVPQPPAADLPPQETAPPAPPAPQPEPEAKAPPKHVQADPQDKVEAKDDGDEDKADTPPGQRQIHGAALVQALDKITAETMRFEIKAGQSLRWKGLVFTLRSCETSAPDEPSKDSFAYLLVRSDPHAQSAEASREIFHGWMFASSPGLHPLKHPVYDAWLISCRA